MKRNYLHSALLLLGIVTTLLTACEGDATTTNTTQMTGNPAVDKLSMLIEQNPDAHDLHAQRAQLFADNEAYDEAILGFQAAMEIDSLQPAYYHALADVYMDYFRSKEALTTMEKAVQRFPKRVGSKLKLSEFYFILKKYPQSLATAQEIFNVAPMHPEAHFMIGRNMTALGKTNQAIANFIKTIKEDPNHVDAYVELGYAYNTKKEPVALRYFSEALMRDSSRLDAFYGKAMYHQQKYEDDKAIGIYKKIIYKDPNHMDAYFNAAAIYFDYDSLDRAFELVDIATKMEPTYAKGYYFKGVVDAKRGNEKAAIAHYQQALTFDPNLEKAKIALEKLGIY